MTPRLVVLEGVPLAPLTTLGVGGAARHYVRIGKPEQLVAAIGWAADRGQELLVLGGGSNVLVSDDGFAGLVVHLAIGGIEFESSCESTDVTVGAGEVFDRFVASAAARNLAGVECLSGIPGLTGATPIQNVGAYGQDVAETIVRVSAVDRATAEAISFENAECEFGYRDSRFKRDDRDRYVVTAVTFRLSNGGPPAIRYPELAAYFESAAIASPSLSDVRDAVISIRRRKAMVIDESDPDSRSAGSFFTNPILTLEEAALAELTGAPRFPAGDMVKISAAWLIEHAGFAKGHVAGNVGISTKHALAIVNRGGGTAREIVALAAEIQGAVRDRFGVELVPEPVYVGEHER